jgi:hypothetical protein
MKGSQMRHRVSQAALVAALAASGAIAQTVPEQVPVRRPDGTIIYPSAVGSQQSGEVVPAMRPDGSVVRPNAAGIVPNAPEAVPVRRPDGSVIYPAAPESRQRAPSSTAADSAYRAEERERMRQDAQRSAEERIDRSRSERDAATTNPARQVPPTTGQ